MTTKAHVPAAPQQGCRAFLAMKELRRPSGWRAHLGDTLFKLLCQSAAILILALAALLVVVLVWRAWESIVTNGLRFFTTTKWDPEPSHREFGALAFIYGTMVTSVIAMVIAVPLGVGTSAFLTEIAPGWLRRICSFLVEMLAAIPSVVYGFWGLYVFAPILRRVISVLGGPEQGGTGLLPAGIVLGIMIVPYAAAVSFDVISAVPRSQREGSLALGASRWQTIWMVVLPYARPGIFGGCFLALGRALGETMAVTMLIGNRPEILFSLFAKGNSIPSVIANEFTEATYDLYLSSLVELGVVLLLVSVGFSALGRLLIWRMSRRPSIGKSKLLGFLRTLRFWDAGKQETAPSLDGEAAKAAGSPSSTPGDGRIARLTNRLMTGGSPREMKIGFFILAFLAFLGLALVFLVHDPDSRLACLAIVAVFGFFTALATLGVLGVCLCATLVPLFLILGYLLYRGGTSLNWDFFTKLPAPVGQPGGGMINAFYGSFLMVGLATVFSVPVGVLAAIYLAEFRSERLGPVVRFVCEMLSSVPSIVIGIFGYYAVVKPITGHFSGLAGGFALGVMMMPIVLRASEEALRLVPKSMRDASHALGASYAQTILRVSLPAAKSAIITAVFLSIARVAGETAPLLLTASSNSYWPRSINDYTPSLPVFIFNYAISPYEDWHRQAWAAAFVLVMFIMFLNVGIRLLTGSRVRGEPSGLIGKVILWRLLAMDTTPRYVFFGFVVIVLGGLAALGILHKSDHSDEPIIQGGGSTFVYPLMVQWSSQYERSENGSRVGYRSLGSGAGIHLFTENRVDFGCTDGPMTDDQLAKARETGADVLHIPLVLGAVVPVYNLPGVEQPVRFSGLVLADIYLGKIKKWNEKPLYDLNPGISLPDQNIAVVHRADGSGTTYVWAEYLSKASLEWKAKVGAATTELKWPTGFAENGNQGVAEKVQKTPGGIGYVELTYAFQFDLGIGLVQNRAKEFVRASLPSVSKAAENALVEIPDDLRFSLTDAPGKGSYPIAAATWALVRVAQKGKKGRQLVEFLNWATGEGQTGVQSLLYAKLPDALIARAQKKIAEIKVQK